MIVGALYAASAALIVAALFVAFIHGPEIVHKWREWRR